MYRLSHGTRNCNSFEQIFVNIFLSVSLTFVFDALKNHPNETGFFEYPQHMFWLKNEKNNFQVLNYYREAEIITIERKISNIF